MSLIFRHSEKYKLYDKLTRAYTQTNPFKSNQEVQSNVNKIWNECKLLNDFEARTFVHIADLEKKSSCRHKEFLSNR